jgi:hypothetical protein
LNIWWIPSESADGAGFTCGEDKRWIIYLRGWEISDKFIRGEEWMAKDFSSGTSEWFSICL